MREKIGARIRDARMKKGISQEKLAELAELSWSCISRLETGRTMVSVEKLIRIADVLNVGVDELLQDFIYGETADKRLVSRILYLLNSCTTEEKLYWVENLRLYVDVVKKRRNSEEDND